MNQVAAARAVYDTIKAGDFAGLRDHLAEDCVIEFYGPPTIPYAGIFRGRDSCMTFFGHVQNDVDILRFDQEDYFGEGDKVCVTGHLTLRARATGCVYDTEYAHVITLRDGKWVRFRDFADTAVVAHAFMPVTTPLR